MLTGNIVFATALYRKDDWERIGGYSEDLKAGLEDYDFWLSILELGKGFHKIPEVLFFYRKKECSMLRDFDNNLSVTKDTYRKIYLKHSGFYEKHKEKYIEMLRNSHLDALFEIRKLVVALAEANETINKLRNEKELIEKSTFWRITKPARFVVDMLRRMFGERKD
jgi:GT2 family glycosyltransferase